MLPDQKEGPIDRNLMQPQDRAEVAVGNPQIVRFDDVGQLQQQAALLGMAILAGDDIGERLGCLGGAKASSDAPISPDFRHWQLFEAVLVGP
jgi:hypothetical protein